MTTDERRAVTLKRKRRSLLIIGNGRAACACCGEREIALLTIDHVNRDGTQVLHRNCRWLPLQA
jgi:hypothetical protein